MKRRGDRDLPLIALGIGWVRTRAVAQCVAEPLREFLGVSLGILASDLRIQDLLGHLLV